MFSQGILGSVGSMFSTPPDKQVGLELFYFDACSNSQSLVLTSISQTTGDQVDTHWMFESGIMDVFIMLGPAPKDVSRLVNEAF